MTRIISSLDVCSRPHRPRGAQAVCVCLVALACALFTGGPAAARTLPDEGAFLADRNGDKLFDTLEARLQGARADEGIEVIVTFRAPLDQVHVPLVQAELGAFGPAREVPLVRAVAMRLTPGQIFALARADIVEQIEPDAEMVAFRTAAMKWFGVTAARTEFGLTGDGDGDPDTFSAADNTIAVIDTGVDAKHVELDGGKVIGWTDLVNNRPAPYDDGAHGTHVASIAAGKQVSSDRGGVAPGAAIVGVKVLNSSGSAPTSRVAQGIEWCVQHRNEYGIRIANLSLGTTGPSDGTDTVSRAVDAAAAAGIIVVCAAGNEGPRLQTVGSPAAARGAIAVGAAADPEVGGVYVPYWSNRGLSRDGRIKPEIIAPGVGISAARANSTDGYVTYSGTSMASPFLAGVIALMLQVSPGLSPAGALSDLTQTARDFGPPGPDSDYGYGLLDAYAALRFSTAASAGTPPFPSHLTGSGAITAETRTVTHTLTITSTEYPIAIALIIANWTRIGTDLDAELLGPDGTRVALSTGSTRQETLTYRPQQAGTYTLRVFAHGDRDIAAYSFDLSAGLQSGS